MAEDETTFTTKELSKQTWPDFERFFSRNGRTYCACMLYQRGGHLNAQNFPSRDEWRTQSLRDKHRLVDKGKAHGILVYAGDESVGWCQFGPVKELPLVRKSRTSARLLPRKADSQWRITCFVTLMEYRGRGIASTALAAAVEAIRKRGGGWVEATPMVLGHYDPELPKLRKKYGPRSAEVEKRLKSWPEVDVPGLGRTKAGEVSAKGGSYQGVMSMFERLGFEPEELDGTDGVLMRLHIPPGKPSKR
jgi:ribosomal protein S18 acetylase RimI-like enzyme